MDQQGQQQQQQQGQQQQQQQGQQQHQGQQQQQQQGQQGPNQQQGPNSNQGPNSKQGPNGQQGPNSQQGPNGHGPQGPMGHQGSNGHGQQQAPGSAHQSPMGQNQQHNQKQGGDVNKIVDKFENVIDQQPKKELPIKTGPQPGNQSNHVQKQEKQQHNQSPQPKKQGQERRDSRESNHVDSRQASRQHSHESSHHGTPPHSRTGTQIVKMSETACSPIGSEPFEKPFGVRKAPEHSGQHDFMHDMPQPRKKTQIIYDLGSPETNHRGISACIPVTTDKYTYTITSILTKTAQGSSPPLSPTASVGGPISSSRVTNKQISARIGRPALYSRTHFFSLTYLCVLKLMSFLVLMISLAALV